ncbi:MAG: hypothetical protein ABJB97_01395 [Acidobacteriota bacterium]
MKRRLGIFFGIALGALVAVNATDASAQQKQPASDRDVIFEARVQGPDSPPPPPGDFIFINSEMSFDGKVVKGSPYSADAVTESTQTLSDGNRIVRKSSAAVYRDSEGRTRREQTLRAIGAFAPGSDAPQMIFISDPVAGTSYRLDPREHVAIKMPPMHFKFQFKTPPTSGEKTAPAPPPDRIEIERQTIGAKMALDSGMVMEWHGTREGKGKTESLGKQVIEGVDAEGTRTTMTIPAGEIGNERPIEMVNERWFSPELQTVVMTRHSDPRFGETVYRLTNISRDEPARSLFEVPADYTLREEHMQKMRTRKPGSIPE